MAADQDHGITAQAIAGGAALLAMIGTAMGGAKLGHRRGSEDRRENDQSVRGDIAEIKASILKLEERHTSQARELYQRIDAQAHETQGRIDQIFSMLGGRK